MQPYDEKKFREFLAKNKGTYETMLWSGKTIGDIGGEDFSKDYCKEHNINAYGEKEWKTLEMLLEEAKMEMPKYSITKSGEDNRIVRETWDNASLALCENSKGSIYFLKGEYGRLNSTFNRVERKAVTKNIDIENVNVIYVNKEAQIYIENDMSKIEFSSILLEKDHVPITSPPQVSYTVEERLKVLRAEYSPRQHEAECLYNRAKRMDKDLTEIRKIEVEIADIKSNRKKYPNAKKQLKDRENSRERLHEFFKREYNVEPANADGAIKALREKSLAQKQAIEPLKDKMDAMQKHIQQQREIEKRVLLDNAQTMTKSYAMSY